MKTKLIFGIIAAIGALVLYLLDKEALAVGFIALIWGVYEKIAKQEIKREKNAIQQENKMLRVENLTLKNRLGE